MGKYSKWDDRCAGCGRLYSLGAECVIISLIVIHVLSSAMELLIHFEVIQVPGEDQAVSNTAAASNQQTTSQTTISTPDQAKDPDPGGSDCDPLPHHDKLVLAVDILQYACLVISALFMVEMACKIVYLRKNFFRDIWQVFDLIVVISSFAVEIAFFVRHDSLLCVHVATQVTTFVIVLRLWRLPRACNIRKKEYSARLDSHIEHLTKTKIETDSRCQHMEKLYQQQEQEIKHLKTILKDANIQVEEKTKQEEIISNGKGPVGHGLTHGVIDKLFNANKTTVNTDETDSVTVTSNGHIHNTEQSHLTIDETNNRNTTTSGHSELERNDSDVNSKANDSGIEVKDSFRSDVTGNSAARVKVAAGNSDEVFDDSDTELNEPKEATLQEVKVQIEETSRQQQLPSITSYNKSFDDSDEQVVLREKKQPNLDSYYVNEAYDADDDMEESRTYKSADGIPTTEL